MKQTHHVLPLVLLLSLLSSCGKPTSEASQGVSQESQQETTVSASEKEEESTGSVVLPGDPIEDTAAIQDIADKYQSIYQILPYTYADSNGDGIGDLKGIKDKLDYIQDMNYTGLWLNPVCSATSYHMYDVKDYESIDSRFGTLADYDALVNDLHGRNMTMIFDLVFNHTSDQHPWFRKACTAYKNGDTSDKYYYYYNFKTLTPDDLSLPSEWGGSAKIPGTENMYYEASFNGGMPDLNLQQVLDDPENSELAKNLKDIIRFWVVDHHVDGFRLDAVTSYFSKNDTKTTQFLKWIEDTARSYNKDIYIVGEGDWGNNSTRNMAFQASGVDSFFNFSNSTSLGPIGKSISQGDSTNFASAFATQASVAKDGIPAIFVGNHDKGRMAGVVGGRKNVRKLAMGHALLQLSTGVTCNYYGDEIGMANPGAATNSDPDKRMHMYWGDDHDCQNAPGTQTKRLDKNAYPYPSVKEQLRDEKSPINLIRKANLLRREFPEIARGVTTLKDTISNDNGHTVTILQKTYNDTITYIAVNSSSDTFEYDYSVLGDVRPVAQFDTGEAVTQRDGKIILPGYSVCILR